MCVFGSHASLQRFATSMERGADTPARGQDACSDSRHVSWRRAESCWPLATGKRRDPPAHNHHDVADGVSDAAMWAAAIAPYIQAPPAKRMATAPAPAPRVPLLVTPTPDVDDGDLLVALKRCAHIPSALWRAVLSTRVAGGDTLMPLCTSTAALAAGGGRARAPYRMHKRVAACCLRRRSVCVAALVSRCAR